MLNWAIRYKPVVRWLDEMDARDVLDVGSGYYGLSCFRPGPVVQTDLEFGRDQPPARRVGEPTFQVASVERLPFEDRSFDAVVSLDMMEHLPDELRNIAVSEMCRVSRSRVIIGCPVGVTAHLVDLAFCVFLKLRGEEYPIWLAEHRIQSAYPTAGQLRASVSDDWQLVSQRGSGNALAILLTMIGERIAENESNQRMPGRRRAWRWPRIFDVRPCYRQLIVWQRI